MKGNRAAIAAVAVIVLVALGWWMFRRTSRAEPVDLLSEQQWAGAKKQPVPTLFTLRDAALGSESRHAIALDPASGTTRLTWRVRVPEDAWLDVAVGLDPAAWDKPGDGVLFRFGVSDGRTYEPLFSQYVNPSANTGDRKWIPVMVDLSAYAGEDVDLIFGTNPSEPGKAENRDNDLALWGAPRVVVR